MTHRPAEQWIPEDTLGDRLRRLRRSMGLSQADFARAIDATPQALASWEIGSREPRSAVAIAKRIELAFNVPATWVLGLITPGGPTPPTGPAGDTNQYTYALRAAA